MMAALFGIPKEKPFSAAPNIYEQRTHYDHTTII
jgi:hypothetical protein